MTLEEIKSAILTEAHGLRITRANYAEIADRVIPRPTVPRFCDAIRSCSDEAESVMRQVNEMQTNDWLDLACTRDAINQALREALEEMER